MRGRIFSVGGSVAFLLAMLLFPLPAFAVQVHAEPEGLYVHQMAHIFFIFSMGTLIYWLRERRLTAHKGWRRLQYAAFFFILWNLNALINHHLEGREDLFSVATPGVFTAWISPNPGVEWVALVSYVTKMDHLLCVPAIVFLFSSLHHLLRSADGGRVKEEAS